MMPIHDPLKAPGHAHAGAGNASGRFGALHSETTLNRLYWSMRLGISFIWIWTAFVSWYVYPHADSIALLRKTGITNHTDLVFVASCLLDLVMGIASCIFARSFLWWSQFLIVSAYTVVISVLLPEFLVHPFGPITKNISVLTCLAILAVADRR
jgi:hypothetical protein